MVYDQFHPSFIEIKKLCERQSKRLREDPKLRKEFIEKAKQLKKELENEIKNVNDNPTLIDELDSSRVNQHKRS